jgi:hypothetical protein
MPQIMPDDRYFSMPSAEVGGDVRRNRALNCWPCVVTVVGHAAMISAGEWITASGEWVNDRTRPETPPGSSRRWPEPGPVAMVLLRMLQPR